MRTKTQLAQEALTRLGTWPDDAVKKLIVSKLKPLADRTQRFRQTKTVSPAGSWPAIRRKLDGVFSEYIRLRDSDENGLCACISCGRMKPWREMDCGHFQPRELLPTRWEPKNCASQCRYCNRMKQGMQVAFARGLDAKYGAGTAQKMEILAKGQGIGVRMKAAALLQAWTLNLETMRKAKSA